jgi:hypothetical protein
MHGRFVHPSYFDGAPRFHGGIGPGERPAILRHDESVLTPGQMRALGRMAGGGAVRVTSVVNNYGDVTAEQNTQDDGQGGLTIETVIRPMENALAGRMARNRGSLAKTARQVPSGRQFRG